MASSFTIFQCSTSSRPLIAEQLAPGAGGLRLSVRSHTAAFSCRKPFRRNIPSASRRTLSIPSVKRNPCCFVVVSAYSVETPPNFLDSLERCFAGFPGSGPSSSSADTMLSLTTMKSYGAHGTVTLEKSKLDLSQKTTESIPELETGGGGGDIGKKNFHGGGDGGDDNGDDDDYFDDFDDGDEGDEGGWFRRRIVLKEFFDRKFVDAVFSEWFKTIADLPGGLRQACEMGLVSSAQLVSFFTINTRPTVSRLIYRSLSSSLSRAFIGRMLADPSFLYKFLLQQATTIGSTIWWEFKNRKGRMKEEWDLALINVATIAACNAFIVWSLAPCRSYGSTFRFDLQNTIQKLPNNVFEKSYPMREFDLDKRIHSFFYKAAELCLVGLTAGAIQGSLTKVISSKKEGRLSMTIPSVNNYALGHGAFLGLYANVRYQLLCGIDRAMFDHFDVLAVGFFFSTMLRVLNIQIGESFRLAWLGIEANSLVRSDNLLKAYNRTSDVAVTPPSSNWFISRNAIISGLGLLGLGQKSGDPARTHSKTRIRRIVKKKISTNLA